MSDTVWCLTTTIPQADISVHEEILSTLGASCVYDDAQPTLFTAYADGGVSAHQIHQIMQEIHKITGVSDFYLEQQKMDRWHAALKQEFPAVTCGDFYIHSGDDVPSGKTGIHIPASLAFGSNHPTTLACLELYQRFVTQKKNTRVLDMGCGSSLLAIAALKAGVATCVCVDNDPESIRVSQENAALNDVTLDTRLADGFSGMRDGDVFDTIFANIFMNHLTEMATDITRYLTEKGSVIVSGFKKEQKDVVKSALCAVNLKLVEENSVEDGWIAQLYCKKGH